MLGSSWHPAARTRLPSPSALPLDDAAPTAHRPRKTQRMHASRPRPLARPRLTPLLSIGALALAAAPATALANEAGGAHHHPPPTWMVVFFVVMLLSIAIIPLTKLEHWWHSNLNKLLLGLALSLYPVVWLTMIEPNFGELGLKLHEYASFITLLGALFYISGGIYLAGDLKCTPQSNTAFLAFGTVIASLIGTTGASMLLIRPVLRAARGRLTGLIAHQRFEDAAVVTDRLSSFARSALRHHRVASLAGCPQIVAAYRDRGGWQIHVVRYGRLAGAARARPGDVPQAVARAAVAAAEQVSPPLGPQPAATTEETERIAAWLERPGVRLIEIEGQWSWPLHIGLAEGELARHALAPADARDAV